MPRSEQTIALPPAVAALLDALHGAGHEASAVGGCVRDSLLGLTPHDWDVCTSALPAQVKEVFPAARAHGDSARHGTLCVPTAAGEVEVTTYRVDGRYSDGRRPDAVAFTGELARDLARRDFTVNAIAFDGQRLHDPFGGRADLAAGLLRAVGDPAARFAEDGLRILRALRLSAQLGFAIEEGTARALRAGREGLRPLSPERVAGELRRLLAGDCVPVLRAYAEVLAVPLPELAPMFGFAQHSRHHCCDVWEHTLHALAAAPPDGLLRLALLFHDCGKPHTHTRDGEGQGHFYGHAARSAQLLDGALVRLRFDTATREQAVRLVALHDHDLPPTEAALRRWLGRLSPGELRRLIALKRCDNAAQSPSDRRMDVWERAERTLGDILARGLCCTREGLAVKGDDLLALGYRGADIGRALDGLLEQVLSGADNTREGLLSRLPPRT